jgi:predicted glutamine amidotransferase
VCKLFALTNVSNVKVNKRLLKVINETITETDRHGFGYAVLGQSGKLGGERSMEPSRFNPLLESRGKLHAHRLPFVEKTSNTFGKLDLDKGKALIAHGRFSTNVHSLENTHPFYNGKIALAHNGVVQDSTNGVKALLKTTCDSEILLRYWETQGINGIVNNVTGYYAMLILDRVGKLHVIRDSIANLYITYVKDIDSYMIATTDEILETIADKMKWDIENIEAIKDNQHIVFDGNTVTHNAEISPKGKTSALWTQAERDSLGIGDSLSDAAWIEKDPLSKYESYSEIEDKLNYQEMADLDNCTFDRDGVPNLRDIKPSDARELIKKYGNRKYG